MAGVKKPRREEEKKVMTRLTCRDTKASHEVVEHREQSRLPLKRRDERASDSDNRGDNKNNRRHPFDFLPPVVPPDGRKLFLRPEGVLDIVVGEVDVDRHDVRRLVVEVSLFRLGRQGWRERSDFGRRGLPRRLEDVGHDEGCSSLSRWTSSSSSTRRRSGWQRRGGGTMARNEHGLG